MGAQTHFALARRAAGTDDRGMKKVLVPVDFSDTQGRLVATAENEARIRGASLVLLHVIEPAAEVAGFETDPEMMRLKIGQDIETEQRIEGERMKELAKGVEASGLGCEWQVKFGLPADEIMAAARDHQVELVVMGSHGHGALYHLFTGSVVTGVLKRIACPVLVVPLRDAAK
jgi:nucleotide-binding universal stress UspA family protein